MFGHNDNQQQSTQDSTDSAQAPAIDQSAIDALSAPTISPTPEADAPSVPDETDLSTPELPSSGTPDPVATTEPDNDSSTNNDDLVSIKQQALQHLSPLVGHLDQTPEEKFRTTMMMIQASDDKSMVKAAFEAAQQISDDKARAQALLDVINEINYFTQNQK